MKRTYIYTGILAALALLAAAGVFLLYRQEYRAAWQETYDSLVCTVDETKLTAEYGQPWDMEQAVTEYTGDAQWEGTVDTSAVGEQTVTLRLSAKDRHGREVTRDWPLTFTVQDTAAPLIALSDSTYAIPSGTSLSLSDIILSVQDPADGPLAYSDTLTPGTYTVSGIPDTSEPCSAAVTVEACDANNNKTTAQFILSVYNAEAAYPFRIRINRALNNVTVYGMDRDGLYTIPVKAMVCSTGAATPLGTYNTEEQYRWRALFGNVYGQYAVRIVDNILFHSVPYYSMSPDDLEYEEYNKLGTAASMGCIRLCVRDEKWIYDNCPLGTEVELYDDPDDPGPLGKPVPLTIDLSSPNRGWDPTDPDPANPWNS